MSGKLNGHYLIMAHPPPPSGPPPEEFRLAIYHIKRKNVRNRNGGQVRVRQIIYRSHWYPTRNEVRMLQAEIKTFLQTLGMLGLIESFTYWRIQKMSDVQRAIARGPGGYQGAERFQPDSRGATEGRGAPSDSSDSRSDLS